MVKPGDPDASSRPIPPPGLRHWAGQLTGTIPATTPPPRQEPQQLPAIALSQVPALPVVEAELDRADASYRERADGLDTKAGAILSAAGVIVALVGLHSSVLGVIGQLASVLAGAAAVWTLMPRVDKAISPQQLFDAYLQQNEISTRLKLLSTRLPLHARNEARLFVKALRLKLSAYLLLGSAAAIVFGAILNEFKH